MRKPILFIPVLAILMLVTVFFDQLSAQAAKKADNDTKIWHYEIQCVGVGVQGTKLIKVFSYSSKPDIAIEQAKKNAVHGAIFQGFAGNGTTGCETQKPLADNPNLEQEKADFFSKFFADGGKYAKFVSVTGDGSIAAEDRMKVGKEFKVGVIVSVLYEELRKDLEAAGIITGLAAPAGANPTIMFFPSDVWMKKMGYVTVVDNQGTKTEQNNYTAALKDEEFSAVLSSLTSMMLERGLQTTDLAATLGQIKNSNAADNQIQNRDGGQIAVSAEDELLKVAKPDIKINVTWQLVKDGPKKSMHFQLDGLDAGTSKPVASSNGDGQPSYSASTFILLKEAVLAHIDQFNSQLKSYFKKALADGKEISLDVKVWDTSPKKLNDEINDEGDELKDDIKKWVSNNSVKHVANLASTTPNQMSFVGVRIPVYNEDGSANDADAFATKLKKYLRKAYKLEGDGYGIGLGKGMVTVGGKK